MSNDKNSGLTKRAPDVWDSARFTGIFLASSFSCSQAESTPAHTQVTQTVGRTLLKQRQSYLGIPFHKKTIQSQKESEMSDQSSLVSNAFQSLLIQAHAYRVCLRPEKASRGTTHAHGIDTHPSIGSLCRRIER